MQTAPLAIAGLRAHTAQAAILKKLWLMLASLTLWLLAGCGPSSGNGTAAPSYGSETATPQRPEYVLAVHPLHNPARLFALYGPLVDWLNQKIPGAQFRLEASRNYEDFERKLAQRQPAFALPNPYQTLQAQAYGYHVVAKMGDDAEFVGLILTRQDSTIERITDLKGHKIAYPAATALAATLLPQAYLQRHGLNIQHDVHNLYVGSQESAIMNVYLGNASAGTTWPLPWKGFQKEHPEQARELVVRWTTEPLINNSIVARDDVPASVVQQVVHELLHLHTSTEGRALLARLPLSRFEAANDAHYQVIRDFLTHFERDVRPLKAGTP